MGNRVKRLYEFGDFQLDAAKRLLLRQGEPFEAYVRGRFLYGKQDKESLLKAIEHYRQATELDPAYALAWAGMADCYVLLNLPTLTMGITPPEESLIRARAAAEKAVELDETLAEAHVSLGAVIATWIHDDDAARREFQRAIELNPNLAQAHSYYGTALMGEVRLEEALVELERARELETRPPRNSKRPCGWTRTSCARARGWARFMNSRNALTRPSPNSAKPNSCRTAASSP